ncbi:MAG: hypothetical protein ACK5HL_04235 [Bacilli bacterium]
MYNFELYNFEEIAESNALIKINDMISDRDILSQFINKNFEIQLMDYNSTNHEIKEKIKEFLTND